MASYKIKSELLISQWGQKTTLSKQHQSNCSSCLSAAETLSVHLSWTKEAVGCAMTMWLLEKPSSHVGACAQRGQKTEEGDITELCTKPGVCAAKSSGAFSSVKPSHSPHHALKGPTQQHLLPGVPRPQYWCGDAAPSPTWMDPWRLVALEPEPHVTPVCWTPEAQSLWEEWRASSPPWVTAPAFSSTKGALLPEATVGCNTHCRGANANVQGQVQHSPGLKGCFPSHLGPKGSHGLSRDHLVQPQSDPRQVPRVPTPSQSSSLLCCPTRLKHPAGPRC